MDRKNEAVKFDFDGQILVAALCQQIIGDHDKRGLSPFWCWLIRPCALGLELFLFEDDHQQHRTDDQHQYF
ncbi:hypothetical protein, partial [Thalassospira lucentensis]|uniref:hypothetical protein n=1 Tax=Thalassospira lucentensis TaxID=168935 RepID=UPI003AA95D1E